MRLVGSSPVPTPSRKCKTKRGTVRLRISGRMLLSVVSHSIISGISAYLTFSVRELHQDTIKAVACISLVHSYGLIMGSSILYILL